MENKVVENIYSLAKVKGIAIKDLEDSVVSTGYLSRLRKNEKTPGMNELAQFAAKLKVDLTDLLDKDLHKMSAEELQIYQFASKLYDWTKKRNIKWQKYKMPEDTITEECEGLMREYLALGEIHDYEQEYVLEKSVDWMRVFYTKLPGTDQYVIFGTAYIREKNVDHTESANLICELYLMGDERKPVYTRRNNVQEIDEILRDLREFLMKDINVGKEVETSIQAFLDYEIDSEDSGNGEQ